MHFLCCWSFFFKDLEQIGKEQDKDSDRQSLLKQVEGHRKQMLRFDLLSLAYLILLKGPLGISLAFCILHTLFVSTCLFPKSLESNRFTQLFWINVFI